MTLLTAVEFLLKLRNKHKQPESACQLEQGIVSMAISLFFARWCGKLTLILVYMLTSPLQACAPVAQRIEHLPCWSLSEKWFEELAKWTAPYAGTPLEPPVLELE
jgi:hypothetical protein